MNFKNHSAGFSIMEVLCALVLIALVVTPLFLQQSIVLSGVYHVSRSLEYMYAAQHFWYEAHAAMPLNAPTFSLEKTLGDGTTLSFSRGPLNAKSPLEKQENMLQESVTIAWQEEGQQKREKIISYVYVIPQEVKV
jgi:prepilin-type N-terminal cleavage/methylation domain-containing protein